VTAPATLVEPVNSVKVVVLIVAGFIALEKVASMTTTLPHVKVEPVSGFTEFTAGGVSGLPGFPAFVSESPQPESRQAARNTVIQTLVNLNLRISFSLNSCKVFRTDGCDTGNGFSGFWRRI
jgi:hypothetical protein